MQSFLGAAIVFAFLAIVSVRGDTATQAPANKPPIKCYTCDNCPDPFLTNITQPASSAPKACPSGVNSCFKYFHTDKRVQRGCSPAEETCPDDTGKKFNLAYCYTCYHENCNSARRMVEVSALPLLVASVASLLGLTIWKRT